MAGPLSTGVGGDATGPVHQAFSKKVPDLGGELVNVVLLARTYGEGREALEKYAEQIPQLADARLASTFAFRVLDGTRTEAVYVAPNTRVTSRPDDYRRSLLVLVRNLRKTSGSDPVVRQINLDGTTEPVDLEALEGDFG